MRLLNLIIILAFFFQVSKTYGQLYDNHILIGDFDVIADELRPFFVKVVNSKTYFDEQNQIRIPLYYGKTSASDSLGNLMFYSDGINIYGSNYQLLKNGANINPGIWRHECIASTINYKSPFSPQFIPFPGHPNQYILFHLGVAFDSLLYEWYYSPLYYTSIDMEDNSGLGGTIEKNVILLDKIFLSDFALCKHGNGRDWWLITRENNDDRYFEFLIDPDGIHGPFIQKFTTNLNRGNGTLDIFSQDGKYYIETNDYLVQIFNFNRCTGQLSLKSDIILPTQQFLDFSIVVQAPLGSDYLYYGWFDRLIQIPLNTNKSLSIASLLTPINVSNDGILAAEIGFSIIAPNNEFYIISANGTKIIHKINKPALPGLSCDFEEDALRLPAKVWGITPVYPNYRLPKETGSGCDTLNLIGSNQEIKSDLLKLKNYKGNIEYSSINKTTNVKSRLELLGKENYINYMKEKNKDIKPLEIIINEMEEERKLFYKSKTIKK